MNIKALIMRLLPFRKDRLVSVSFGQVRLTERPEYIAAQREATVAQKNLRLASIARTRAKLKEEIARLKRNKKRHSHLVSELVRLTRMELELESGR